ncbi:MAG TPA: 16S rRNA (cytidine(1402)-2'-O)-methyltransferase, partial [Aquabacterium sp.]|nr:16S rRNA (cytidine(1402)-2'-O)-methyltransferase [Aquabacterium sp.]
QVTVGRELTKQFEEVATMACAALPSWLQIGQRQRGEFVLVWHAPHQGDEAEVTTDLPASVLEILTVLSDTLPVKEAARLLAEVTGLSRNRLYQAVLDLRQGDTAQEV